MGTEQGDPPLATVRYLPVRTTPAEDVVDGELVDDEDDQLTSQRAQAMERYRGYRQDMETAGRLVARAVRVTPVPDLRRVPAAIWTGHAVWARRISDRANHAMIRHEIAAARMTGDQVAIAAWTDRLVAAQHRRWEGIQHAPQTVRTLLKTAGLILAVLMVALVGIGILCAVYHPLGVGWSDWWGLISTGINLAATMAVIAVNIVLWGTVPLWLIAAYRAGRGQPPAPVFAVPADTGADPRAIVPTTGAILDALRQLGVPSLDRAFKAGWASAGYPVRVWVADPHRDGNGWRAQLALPQGVPVEMIAKREKRAILAHNLARLPVEVWPTEPKEHPGVLDLWVADQGSLTGPVPSWPLLADLANAQMDYFRGVPVGVNIRGDTVNARLFECNYVAGGIMGSGKSTLIIGIVAGAMLDPIVDIDIRLMADNADYLPFEPRLRSLAFGAGPDVVRSTINLLAEVYIDLQQRGKALREHGERASSRKLAEKDSRLRPRLIVIDECQALFMDAKNGETAADQAIVLQSAARKYGITIIWATPEPTNGGLPRKLVSTASHKACFPIGDHTSNDSVLGTGSYKAGVSAVGLDPKTDESLGDVGTAMTRGFSPKPSLLRCYYITQDDAHRITQRALALQAGLPPAIDTSAEDAEVRDLLADVVTVMAGKPRMRSEAVRRFLADEWPVYAAWSAQRFSAALREAGKPVGLAIRKGRLDGAEGQQHIVLDEVLAALSDRAEQMEDTPEDP